MAISPLTLSRESLWTFPTRSGSCSVRHQPQINSNAFNAPQMTMPSKRNTALCAVLVLELAAVLPASANTEALQEVSWNAAATIWSVSPAPRQGVPQNTPLQMSWTVVTHTAYSYFDAVNTGAEELSMLTLTAISSAVAHKANNATVTFELCHNGIWNPLVNTCDGTVVQLGSYTGPNTLSVVINQNFDVGERVALRATTAQNRRDDLSTTVSVSVSRDGVRAPATRDS